MAQGATVAKSVPLHVLIPASHVIPQGVEIINTANGNTASGMVADVCPSCGTNDLGMPTLFLLSEAVADRCSDLSQSLFEELGNINDGVLPITWYFT